MSGLFRMRTRKRLYLRTREMREAAAFGHDVPPIAVPARTEVAVIDLFTSGAYVQLPDGTRAIVPGDLLYTPRSRKGTA